MDLKNLLFTSELSRPGRSRRSAESKSASIASIAPAFSAEPPPKSWSKAPTSGAAALPFTPPVKEAPPQTSHAPKIPQTSSTSSVGTTSLGHLLPTLLELKGQILRELEHNSLKLRTLNSSRREKLMKYLERVASLPPSAPAEAAAVLSRWIEGPRTPAQSLALQTYFEEIALLVLGQVLLLKAWSDRGLRPWKQNDIGDLNWELGSALRNLVPLDRETWNIARATIYSWYKPSVSLQQQIWTSLEHWKLGEEGPGLLNSLLCGSGKSPTHPRLEGYDPRFFQAVWDALPALGFDCEPESGPLKRRKQVFSPTLRDGTLVRTSPPALHWVGTEQSAFLLMSAELIQLWWGPCEPPLWARMDGLETHSRDQLSLDLISAKPSLLSRIKDMEAFDFAFVLEERSLRAQGRSAEAHRFREQLDVLPYFKKIRASGTSLGALQACVSLTKLRPGGLMLWAREEPLTSAEGQDMLRFLLDRGRLVAEWDFTRLEHSLPPSSAAGLPLFPKYLYLFAREPRIEERLSHRPLKLTVQGQLRSHVEVPLAMRSALSAARPDPQRPAPTHAHWQIHSHLSPSRQRDWLERWPDGSASESIHRLEKLREASLSLATACTVRATPEGEVRAHHGKSEHCWTVPRGVKGLWMRAELGGPGSDHEGERRLVCEVLPEPGTEMRVSAPSGQPACSSMLVLIPHDGHVGVLSHYLSSTPVREWLEHHAERRADRWILSEQTIKYIPVPKSLLTALGVPHESLETNGQELTLPQEWEGLCAGLAHDPGPALAKFRELVQAGGPARARVSAPLFVRASRAIQTLQVRQTQVGKVVHADGRISWRALLSILAAPECTSVTFHPLVRTEGQLPPHIVIDKIERIANPSPGILLMTSLGMSMKILPEAPALLEMIWEQLQGIEHPTWGDLVKYLKVPRRLEVAQDTAADILKSYREVKSVLEDLRTLQEEIARGF